MSSSSSLDAESMGHCQSPRILSPTASHWALVTNWPYPGSQSVVVSLPK